MARRTAPSSAVVGVSDHGGWAVLMTVAADGAFLDRRRVDLVDADLPKIPYHHEAQGLPMEKAVMLVGRVRASAERHSRDVLEKLARDVPAKIVGIALRTCPPLPETIEERITDYRAQNNADWVMYRQALAGAAAARGWHVHWFDARRVFDKAAAALRRKAIEDLLEETGAALGPPWQKDHRMAMAAAIAASASRK